jgi:hypothetical protein
MDMLYKEYKSLGAPAECLAYLSDRGSKGTRYGVTSHGIRFSRVAQVASGDGDTTAGNTRIHLVLLQNTPGVVAAMVMGDDAIVLADSPVPVLAQYIRGGFDPKKAEVFDFCSQYLWPAFDGNGIVSVLGPKIGRVLAKTFISTHNFDESKQLEWLKGVCLRLEHSVSFIPILRTIVSRFLELTEGKRAWYESEYEYKIHCGRSFEVAETTWVFLQQVYGVDESTVVALEAYIQQATLPMVLPYELFGRFVEADT